MMNTQIKPEANRRLAAPQGSASPCPHCAHLEISGTYKPHPLDKCEKPLRVQSVRGETAINHGDFETLEMARAGACGTRDAVILQREPNQ